MVTINSTYPSPVILPCLSCTVFLTSLIYFSLIYSSNDSSYVWSWEFSSSSFIITSSSRFLSKDAWSKFFLVISNYRSVFTNYCLNCEILLSSSSHLSLSSREYSLYFDVCSVFNLFSAIMSFSSMV